MQKIKMSRGTLLTFEEGCNKYLENCRQRNLRDDSMGCINNIETDENSKEYFRESGLKLYRVDN